MSRRELRAKIYEMVRGIAAECIASQSLPMIVVTARVEGGRCRARVLSAPTMKEHAVRELLEEAARQVAGKDGAP